MFFCYFINIILMGFDWQLLTIKFYFLLIQDIYYFILGIRNTYFGSSFLMICCSFWPSYFLSWCKIWIRYKIISVNRCRYGILSGNRCTYRCRCTILIKIYNSFFDGCLIKLLKSTSTLFKKFWIITIRHLIVNNCYLRI